MRLARIILVRISTILSPRYFSPSLVQSIPFYIFSESYGGKMAAAVSLELNKVREHVRDLIMGCFSAHRCCKDGFF